MKKSLILFLVSLLFLQPSFAKADKNSAEFLKNKRHFAIMNPFAESLAQKIIKNALKKEVGKGNYQVKFDGYNLSSMKKGIFKYLEITAKDTTIDNIPIPYMKFVSLTDYNWIDYNEKPVKIKSDMIFGYNLKLDEKSVNNALLHKEYKKTIEKVNERAYPLFKIYEVQTRIKNDKIYIIMDYDLPLATGKKKRKFIISSKFSVTDGKIKADDVRVDKRYGNISVEKVTNLINMLDPLTFTLGRLNGSKCKSKIENVKIEDNIIQINGKIFIESKNKKGE